MSSAGDQTANKPTGCRFALLQGTSDKKGECLTCKGKLIDCAGHYGASTRRPICPGTCRAHASRRAQTRERWGVSRLPTQVCSVRRRPTPSDGCGALLSAWPPPRASCSARAPSVTSPPPATPSVRLFCNEPSRLLSATARCRLHKARAPCVPYRLL